MANVVDQKRVAVSPSVKVLDRIEISGKEWRMEGVPGPLLGGNAKRVLDRQECERTLENPSPVNSVLLRWGL